MIAIAGAAAIDDAIGFSVVYAISVAALNGAEDHLAG
jgi:hypothetical protein